MPAVTTLQPTQPDQNQTQAQPAFQKQTTQLPYTDNSGTLLPIVPKPKVQQNATAADLQQGSNNVMAAAQRTALQKANQPDPTMGAVQMGVQELLKKPMGNNYDAQKVNQNQLEQYDRNRAQAMAAFQQQNADIANTGINREAAYNFAMQGAQGRSDLEGKQIAETAERERLALLDALKLGQSTAQTQSGLDTDAFNRLITARGAFEGERAQTSQQDFAAGQGALDRAQQLLVQSNDQAGQQALATLQGKISAGQQATAQDFTAAQAALERQLKVAMQGNDLQAQKDIQAAQADLQARLQASQQSFTAGQSALDRAQQLLVQSNDQTGQQTLATLQGQIQTGQILQANDFKAAQAALDRAQQTALQANDIAAQQNITQLKADLAAQAQKAQQQFESGENALNRTQQLLVQSNDIAGQKDITTLQGQIKAGEMLAQNDFSAAQAALDRAQQTALQSGDIAGQKEITTLKASLDAAAQKAQNDFATATREATQDWQTGKRIDTQNYDRQVKALDRAQQMAMQSKDIAAQKAIEDNKAKLQLQMQTNEMNQQEKMAYLDSQLADARAQNDVGRQMTIIGFQTSQDMYKIQQSQGFEAAQKEADRRFQHAAQVRDITAQKALQMNQLAFQREELAQQKVLADAENQMKDKGLNATILEQQYNQIKDASGPDAAAAFLKTELGKQGITVQAPDPLATQKAIQADYDAQAMQYAMTHPEYLVTNSDGSIGLTDAGKQAFYGWYNENIYGNSNVDKYLSGDLPISNLQGGTSDDYRALVNRSMEYYVNAPITTGAFVRMGDELWQKQEDGTYVFVATGEKLNRTQMNDRLPLVHQLCELRLKIYQRLKPAVEIS